jgi:hypothetical protein
LLFANLPEEATVLPVDFFRTAAFFAAVDLVTVVEARPAKTQKADRRAAK